MTDAVQLAPLTTPAGLMERLFLHETRSPAYGGSYDRVASLRAMRLMRQVLHNRLKHPEQWGARNATNEIPLITIKSQFGQFGLFPRLPVTFMAQVEEMVASANSSGSYLHAANLAHVQDAILAATEASPPDEIAALGIVSWRTARHGSPGSNFRPVVTVQGNTFFEACR